MRNRRKEDALMTDVWFIRHAEADLRVPDPRLRPLTEKGRIDRLLIADFFRDKAVSALYSSPYRRAVETLEPLAEEKHLNISTDMSFAEFHAGNIAPGDAFLSFVRACFSNPALIRSGGESFAELVRRQTKMLQRILFAHSGQTVVIGTHSLALSALAQSYDPLFGFAEYENLSRRMPLMARMIFDGTGCAGMQWIDPLQTDPTDKVRAVETAPLGAMNAYRFVVIFARYRDKWVFCRAKTRNCFELPGGHIENGETPFEAARRELYEETGARNFTLSPLSDYRVRCAREYSNGQIFRADIEDFSPLPDYEMAEIRFFDALPATLRFPEIYTRLYQEFGQSPRLP